MRNSPFICKKKNPAEKQTELFNATVWWKGFIWIVLGLFLVSFVLLLLFFSFFFFRVQCIVYIQFADVYREI